MARYSGGGDATDGRVSYLGRRGDLPDRTRNRVVPVERGGGYGECAWRRRGAAAHRVRIIGPQSPLQPRSLPPGVRTHGESDYTTWVRMHRLAPPPGS